MDAFAAEWKAFPSLKDALFTRGENGIYRFCTEDAKGAIEGNKDVAAFINDYDSAFANFGERLEALLINGCEKLDAKSAEEGVAEDIFRRMREFPLLDKYEAYQMLDDAWQIIERDSEAIVASYRIALLA